MRRLPILPTLIVLSAVATMIGLGVWQLRRAVWKEALLARYAAAQGAPLLHGLPDDLTPARVEALGFRRAAVTCALVDRPTQIGGRGPSGEIGYRTILPCTMPRQGTLMADVGWSRPGAARPPLPFAACIRVVGRLIPDEPLARRVLAVSAERPVPLLLVAETPARGLSPSVAPSIADIPNNHRAYAVQWFLFAATALIVYALALRRRRG